MLEVTFWAPRGSSLRSFKEHAVERVEQALRNFENRVHRVRVSFDDLNGPKGGGRDQECRILLTLRGRPGGIFVARAESAGQALADAIGKMRRSLSRQSSDVAARA